MDFKDTQSEEIVFPGSVDEIPATVKFYFFFFLILFYFSKGISSY